MASDQLKLKLVLDTINKASAPLKAIDRDSGSTAKALKASRDQLKQLQAQQKDVSSFQKLQTTTRESAEALRAQQARAAQLARELKTTATPTKALQREFDRATSKSKKLEAAHAQNRNKLNQLNSSLKKSGMNTANLDQRQEQLTKQIKQANHQIDSQKNKLVQLGNQQKKLQAIRTKAGVVGDRFQGARASTGALARTAAIAGTLAGGGVFALANSTATLGDNVAKTADKIGIALGPLQELRYAAERSGVSTQKFDSSLERYIKRLGEANMGTGAAKKAYEEMGLSIEDLIELSPEKSLGVVADRLAKVEDQSKRVALAAQLFGREGVAMVNMLKDGGDGLEELRRQARLTGYVLSDQAARDAEVFKDRLLDAQLGLQGMKNMLGAELMPVISELMQSLSEWMIDNRDRVNDFAKTFARRFKESLPAIKNFALGLASMAATFGAITSAVADSVGGFENLGKIIAVLLALKPIVMILSLTQSVLALGTAFMGILKLAPLLGLFKGLIALLPFLSGGFAMLGAAIAATPIGWLIGAAAAIIGLGVLIYKNWEPIGEFFEYLGEKIGKLVGWAKGAWNSIFGDGDKNVELTTTQKELQETIQQPKLASTRSRLKKAGAGVVMTSMATSAAAIDTRPPLQAHAPAPSSTISVDAIHVHAEPGMDELALAKLVRQEIQKLEQQQAANKRSSLHDED